MIYMAGGNAYRLVHDHKNGWNPEAFRERFSEVLERYDYVVGDWGYNQLRLKGFYKEQQSKAPKDAIITSLVDYINEYCNFGCAYFVLEKTDPRALPEGAELTRAAAEGESAEQSFAAAVEAAMSAHPSGLLLRWPLKERPGGRVPGTSPSAVARAVSEGAERRAAAAQAALSGAPAQGDGGARGGADGGAFGRARPQGGDRSGGERDGLQGRDRRPPQFGGGPRGSGQSAGAGDRSGGRSGGGSGRYAGAPPQASRSEGGDRSPGFGGTAAQGDGGSRHAGGGRWAGKNRRRGGFHGKPQRPRHEGEPRPDGGHRPESGHSGGERP